MLNQNLQTVKILDKNIIRSQSDPVHKEGGIAVLKGNLAPNGSVVKQVSVPPSMMKFTGSVKVFNRMEEATKALLDKKISHGEIIVIRYEGPKGGPGRHARMGVICRAGARCAIICPLPASDGSLAL